MFIDTNILVHAAVPTAPQRIRARAALSLYSAAGEELFVSRQVLREFVGRETPLTPARRMTSRTTECARPSRR